MVLSRVIDIALRNVVPDVFKRPYLSVLSDSTLMQAAPFMAIGPQIYVDGLVVTEEEKPIGIITSKHILISIINSNYPDWLKISASKIMDSSGVSLEMDSPLSKAIDIFSRTSIAFLPVTRLGLVVASLSIRDILPIIAASGKNVPLKDISSSLVLFSKETNLKVALDTMFQKRIRNIIIRAKNDDYYVINDRKILEFLFSENGRKIMNTHDLGIQAIEIDLMDKLPAKRVSDNTNLSKAAELLMDIDTPCLLLNESIVTPWDIVMKTIERMVV
jgi:predicted transcriptional regulator